MPDNFIDKAKEKLREMILKSLGGCITEGKLPASPIKKFNIEIPSNKAHGSLSTNIAMVCAGSFKMSPLQIAQIIMENVEIKDTYFERYEIVAPGFINMFFNEKWYKEVLSEINIKGAAYGRSNLGEGKKVIVEFVSANPTGPMHLGNARGGVLGDCLASVLEYSGYNVTREFYVNDTGNQIYNFGKSLEARYLQVFKGSEIPFPDEGYKGKDVIKLVHLFLKEYDDKYLEVESDERREVLINFALPKNISKMKEDLKRYKIEYDNWFKESSLFKNGQVDKIISMLRDAGAVYERDGITWFNAMKYGGAKDEVLIKSNGFSTYFASDIAYHYNKFVVRKCDKAINIWGADHHGHVERLKIALKVLGVDESKLTIILMQLVRLTQGGEIMRMSKRTGQAVTLETLLDEVPIDAARFFFNMREASTHLDFDLDLALKTTSDNPVYYIQYAYARLCNILLKAERSGLNIEFENIQDEGYFYETDEEKELIKMMALFPLEVKEIAVSNDSSLLTKYAINLASSFHKFYNNCPVVIDNINLRKSRLYLCNGLKIVLKNVLSLMKIEALERM